MRMMEVTISGMLLIHGENVSVIHNTHRPDSALKKNYNSIFYQVIRESVAMKEILMWHMPSADDPADIFTKFVPGGAKRKHFIGNVLYYL